MRTPTRRVPGFSVPSLFLHSSRSTEKAAILASPERIEGRSLTGWGTLARPRQLGSDTYGPVA